PAVVAHAGEVVGVGEVVDVELQAEAVAGLPGNHRAVRRVRGHVGEIAAAAVEAALVGDAVTDGPGVVDRVRGPDAGGALRGVLDAVAAGRIGIGRAVPAGTGARVAQAFVGDALQHFAVEPGRVREHRPALAELAGDAEAEAVDAGAAVVLLLDLQARHRIPGAHAVVLALVAEDRGGQREVAV